MSSLWWHFYCLCIVCLGWLLVEDHLNGCSTKHKFGGVKKITHHCHWLPKKMVCSKFSLLRTWKTRAWLSPPRMPPPLSHGPPLPHCMLRRRAASPITPQNLTARGAPWLATRVPLLATRTAHGCLVLRTVGRRGKRWRSNAWTQVAVRYRGVNSELELYQTLG